MAVAYGNVEETNDELSVTESIPPPPPAGEKTEDSSQEDSPTESPSANDEAEDSVDEKKEVGQIKRRKLLLIATCVVTFFILLGSIFNGLQITKNSEKDEIIILSSGSHWKIKSINNHLIVYRKFPIYSLPTHYLIASHIPDGQTYFVLTGVSFESSSDESFFASVLQCMLIGRMLREVNAGVI